MIQNGETQNELLSVDYLLNVARRCAAATLGPWVSYVEGREHTSGSNFIMLGDSSNLELLGATIVDQDFIAHARQDIPILLNEINKLRKMLGIETIPNS